MARRGTAHTLWAMHTVGWIIDAQISIIDEKYADLPARVRWLEVEVFPSTRR